MQLRFTGPQILRNARQTDQIHINAGWIKQNQRKTADKKACHRTPRIRMRYRIVGFVREYELPFGQQCFPARKSDEASVALASGGHPARTHTWRVKEVTQTSSARLTLITAFFISMLAAACTPGLCGSPGKKMANIPGFSTTCCWLAMVEHSR